MLLPGLCCKLLPALMELQHPLSRLVNNILQNNQCQVSCEQLHSQPAHMHSRTQQPPSGQAAVAAEKALLSLTPNNPVAGHAAWAQHEAPIKHWPPQQHFVRQAAQVW